MKKNHLFPDAVVEAGITNVFFVSPFPPSSGAGISLSLQEVNSPPVSITAAIPVNNCFYNGIRKYDQRTAYSRECGRRDHHDIEQRPRE